MRRSSIKYLMLLSFAVCSLLGCMSNDDRNGEDEALESLARQFRSVPDSRYRPYVWWHWMGSNFSKEGITEDLEAMAEAGIGGATIFNISSGVQESHKPLLNNPWPEKTYRSEYYWDALKHAAAEAKRLGLKIGIQGTPGYSTTGGPWIDEDRCMQMLVSTKAVVKGGDEVWIKMEKPVPPVYSGWGNTGREASSYNDIAVLAIPDKDNASAGEVIDITEYMNDNGLLRWNAPSGRWIVVRLGYAPTMSNPHPLPDELIGNALEADKMSREVSVYHWNNVIQPLKEELGEYFGDSFSHILIDSYESGEQNWTDGFRDSFIERKGYDPLPYLALREAGVNTMQLDTFENDFSQVIGCLFVDNGWKVAKEMISDAGLEFYWEPYHGPFDTYSSVEIPDLPMGEFWVGGNGEISGEIVSAAAEYGKKIVGAEAFTGHPSISKYTEDPEFLKPSADGCFASGGNMLFLHHWVHQPFDDRIQPGIGMGWWGSHFGRNQTWIKPARAFFTYLSRCQMLLQQGEFVSTDKTMLHRKSKYADLFFIINPADTVVRRKYSFPVSSSAMPELWDAYNGKITYADKYSVSDDSVYVDLEFMPHESVFVVFPSSGKHDYEADRPFRVQSETEWPVDGEWSVTFYPKMMKPFSLTFPELKDLSQSVCDSLKYFSGTAVYRKDVELLSEYSEGIKRVILDLGELDDIAELYINGSQVSVLWFPPFRADITKFLIGGRNTIEIHVTNNWANRLIGDEQYPADFELGDDRGDNGIALKAFPDWLVNGEERLQKRRVSFSTWYYYRKDSKPYPAGLQGPVRMIEQDIVQCRK